MENWKGVRRNLHQGNTRIELYNLATDVGEQHDVAAQHPDIVKRVAEVTRREHLPSEVFPMKVADMPAR